MNSLMLGLIAMMGYGISDFLLKKPSERLGQINTMYLIYLISFVMSLPLLIYVLFLDLTKIVVLDYLLMFLIVIFDLIAFTNFLAAIRIGELSLVTPIVSCYSLVTVLLSVLVLGEILSLVHVAAICLILTGIVLTSTDVRKLSKMHTIKGVSNAVIAFLAWGVFVFLNDVLLERLSPSYGDMNSILISYSVGSVISIAAASVFFFWILKSRFGLPDKSLGLRLGIISLVFKIAWAGLSYGLIIGMSSIVTPISSLSPAITVILAQIFYKERLVLNQKIGIPIILLGLVLISL